MVEELVKEIEALLELKVGDEGRLKHIWKSVETNKEIYQSDRKYVEFLASKYLVKNDITFQSDNEEKPVKPSKSEKNQRFSNLRRFETFDKIEKEEKETEKPTIKINSEKLVSENPLKIRSNWWYLLPILFDFIGGIIAYFIIRDDDSKKGKNCLLLGLILTLAKIGIGFLSTLFFSFSSIPIEGIDLPEFQI